MKRGRSEIEIQYDTLYEIKDFIVKKDVDWLEVIDCPVPVYINLVECGRKDVFDNWSRSFILDKTLITTETVTDLSTLTPDEQNRSMQSVELAVKTFHRIFQLISDKQRVVGVAGRTALSVSFAGYTKCFGSCGNVHSNNQDGYIGLDGLIGSASNVYYTDDGGTIWYPTTSNPFQTSEGVSGVAVVQSSPDGHTVIVARGAFDGLNPMEIAYSSDRGTTWTNVNVGFINGQYAIGRGNPIFAINNENIWLVTTGGHIYFSDDVGLTWTAQENGTVTAENLHAIHFSNDQVGVAVGEQNIVIRTVDGTNWELVAAPALEAGNTAQAVHVFTKDRFWVGYDSGNLWFTNDGGVSWFERNYPMSGSGEIQDIRFCTDYIGYVISINSGGTAGYLYRTINGGWSWVAETLPVGTGPLYNTHVCECNQVYAAGEF